MKFSKKIIIGLSFTAITLFVITINIFNYDLRIIKNENSISIQTLLMGEYYTPVMALHIYDSNNIPVVKITAKSHNSVLHTISINEGISKFDDMYLDQYEIYYPQGELYHFIKNEQYYISVKWLFSNRKSNFIL